jgi:preprotein translocase subunit YajC
MRNLGQLLPLVLLAVVFWFLILRPSRARQREALSMRSALVPGAHIQTTGGLHGIIQDVDGDTVRLEIAPGVVTTWAVAAVAKLLTPVTEVTSEPTD